MTQPPKYALVYFLDETIVDKQSGSTTRNRVFKTLHLSFNKDQCVESMINHRINNLHEIKDDTGNVVKRVYPSITDYYIYKLDTLPHGSVCIDLNDDDIIFE